MKLLVGLGNPGGKYENTRHNAGYFVVDTLKKMIKNTHREVILTKTLSFMNESGEAVKKLMDRYRVNVDDIYIVHDDLDIRLGEYKIQKGRGPKVHYGVQSIENSLGTKDFWRVRVGVDRRDLKNRIPGEEYVLQKFDPDEIKILDNVVQCLNHSFPFPTS